MTCRGCGNPEATRIRVYESGEEGCNLCMRLTSPFALREPSGLEVLAKSQHDAIKFMANCSDKDRNHIPDKKAARWKRLFVDGTAARHEIRKRMPEHAWRPGEEQAAHDLRVQDDDKARRQKAADENLQRVFASYQSDNPGSPV